MKGGDCLNYRNLGIKIALILLLVKVNIGGVTIYVAAHKAVEWLLLQVA